MDDKALGRIETDLKGFVSRHNQKQEEQEQRLFRLEQKAAGVAGAFSGDFRFGDEKSVAEQVTQSDQFKSFMSLKARNSGQIGIGSFHKANLVNSSSSVSTPVMAGVDRYPGFIAPGIQRLTIRDLLARTTTQLGLVEFCKETGFTNNAGIQAAEGDTKGESAFTFSLTSAPVRTVAHFLPASRQLLDDAQSLQTYLNTRLLYGLKFKEEQELLNGSGSGSEISGLVTNAATYDTNRTTVTTDTFVDVLSHAIEQVYDGSFYTADGIVLHTKDWERIRLIKTNQGAYVFSDPYGVVGDRLWGLPVVPTTAIGESQFLVGAFKQGAMIWDRQDATVEISREHSDFFARNLVAILCEERLALTIFNGSAFVYGGFPYGS